MEKTRLPFTKQDLVNELRCVLVNLAACLGAVYGPENSHRLLGEAGSQFSGTLDDDIENLDISSFPVTAMMEQLYDYAFHGVNTDIAWDVVELDCYAFFAGLKKFYMLVLDGFTVLPQSREKCMHTLDLAAARCTLSNDDEDGSVRDFVTILEGGTPAPDELISLRHVALLAGLDEKTVRNLAGPNSKRPLATVSVANRTYVEISVAREWLRSRGIRVETVIVNQGPIRDLSVTGFLSIEDLNFYIGKLMQADNCSRKGNELGPDDFRALEAMRAGQFSYDVDFCIRLARRLGAEPVAFTEAVVKLFQSVQMERIRVLLRGELGDAQRLA